VGRNEDIVLLHFESSPSLYDKADIDKNAIIETAAFMLRVRALRAPSESGTLSPSVDARDATRTIHALQIARREEQHTRNRAPSRSLRKSKLDLDVRHMLTVRDSSSRLREVECIEFTVFYTPHDVDSHIPREFHPSLAVSPPHNPLPDLPSGIIHIYYTV